MITKWKALGNPLVVQWLELRAFTTKGPHSIPGGETKIPGASWPKNENMKQKQYFNKFNKDLKKDTYTV